MPKNHESIAQMSVQDYYFEYVDAAGSESAQLAMARSASREVFKERYHEGGLELSEADLEVLHDAVFTSVDSRAGQNAERLILQAVEWGMDSLLGPEDPTLKVPATLGGGRRKSLRSITPEDLADMYQERETNRDRVVQAARRFEQAVATATPILTRYGTFGDAALAGEFARSEDAA